VNGVLVAGIKKLDLDGISLLPGLKTASAAKGHDILFFRRAVAAGVRDAPLTPTFRFRLKELQTNAGGTGIARRNGRNPLEPLRGSRFSMLAPIQFPAAY
jgi:hypothetical protein